MDATANRSLKGMASKLPICQICREDYPAISVKHLCKKSKLKARIADLEKAYEDIKRFPDNYFNEVQLNAELFARIDYALKHCPNNQGGVLCDICYMLENGVARELNQE